MSESDIAYVMRTENVSRYTAMKVLEAVDNHLIRVREMEKNKDYNKYLSEPLDPRD